MNEEELREFKKKLDAADRNTTCERCGLLTQRSMLGQISIEMGAGEIFPSICAVCQSRLPSLHDVGLPEATPKDLAHASSGLVQIVRDLEGL